MLMLLGIVSIALTITFTWVMARGNGGPGQSRRSSMIEAWINIAIGFAINYVANLVFLPLVGLHVTMVENLWLGAIYTSVSVIRTYVIRRWFNAQLHRVAAKFAERSHD